MGEIDIFAGYELKLEDPRPLPDPSVVSEDVGGVPEVSRAQAEWELVAELAKEDLKICLEYIYAQYYNKLMGYVYKRTQDREVTQEIVQSVFQKVMEQYKRDGNGYVPNKSFSGWIFRIATNLVIDRQRRSNRRTYLEWDERLDALRSDNTPLAFEVIAKADRDLLIKAIPMLKTSDQKEVIRLRFLEQLSIRETAELMGKSDKAVKALQYRAIIELQRIFATLE